MSEMKGGEFYMDGLQNALNFAPLLVIGTIIVGALLLVIWWLNTKGGIVTTRETIEWLEEDPITNQKLKHTKVIITQGRK